MQNINAFPCEALGGRAFDLLDEHYAKGDINREEYQQRKQDVLGR